MIINLVGPPASGKSTFSAKFVLEHPEYRFCSIDAYRVTFENEDKAWHEMLRDVQSNQDIILESCGWGWRLKNLLGQYPVRQRYISTIEFTGNLEDIKARLLIRQNKRPIPMKYDPMDEFHAIDQTILCNYVLEPKLVVLTSRAHPEEQYESISKFIVLEKLMEHELRNAN